MSCKVASHTKMKSAIDDLPTDIIHKILEYLPIQDAARTSILSKKWRELWSTQPHLKFDRCFFDYAYDIEKTGETAGDIIHDILLQHSGPILGVHLTSGVDNIKHVVRDEWVIFIAAHGLQKLTIDLTLEEEDDPYEVPCEIFTCSALTHLCLRCCIIELPPPAFKGFDKLISMKLYSSSIRPNFIESLSNEVIEINAPRLEILVLDYDNLIDCKVIEINAPRLRSFDFHGSERFITLKNSDLLEKLSVSNCFGKWDIVKFLKSFSTLDHLHSIDFCVTSLVVGAVEVPTRFPFSMNCVKRLCLRNVDLGCSNGVSYALCLIRSLPYLQYLEIQVRGNVGGIPVPESVLEEGFLDLTFSHLREVKLEIRNIRSKTEMQLIKLLLAKSPVLLRMFVKPRHYVRCSYTPDQFVRIQRILITGYDFKISACINASRSCLQRRRLVIKLTLFRFLNNIYVQCHLRHINW